MANVRATITFILILLCLMTLSVVYLQPAKAQYRGDIRIAYDGSVTPISAPIVQSGNQYSLISDISGMVVIGRSNITFDGNGYVINQYATTQDDRNAYGIYLDHVYNVTVANTTVVNTGNGIYAIQNPTGAIGITYGGSNTIIGNNIANNYNAMNMLETNQNIITQNNFTNNINPYVIVSSVMLWGSSYNIFYQNNFIGNKKSAGTASFNSQSIGNKWDNGTLGNYWDDYNGTDSNGDGIGDTPYLVSPQNADNYPLMQPFRKITNPSPTPTIPEATSSLTPNIPRNPPHLDPIYYLIPVSVIVAVILASVLIYRRHQKKTLISKR